MEIFGNIVNEGWSIITPHQDCARIITAKFKNLKKLLKEWKKNLSNLKTVISNIKKMFFSSWMYQKNLEI